MISYYKNVMVAATRIMLFAILPNIGLNHIIFLVTPKNTDVTQPQPYPRFLQHYYKWIRTTKLHILTFLWPEFDNICQLESDTSFVFLGREFLVLEYFLFKNGLSPHPLSDDISSVTTVGLGSM